MAEYRIEYSIQRSDDGAEDFTEIGFGSSGTWDSISQAAHMVESDIANRAWETRPGMPDPDSIGEGDSEPEAGEAANSRPFGSGSPGNSTAAESEPWWLPDSTNAKRFR